MARQILKGLAALADRIVGPDSGLVVLIYHRVGGLTHSEVDLPLHVFAAQLAELSVAGRVESLESGVADLATQGGTSAGRVVVSFDDGTSDFAEHVLPVLVEAGVPAVLYLATAFVEEERCYPNGAAPISWAGLRDALSTGLVTLGSHTHTHRLLDRVDGPTAADELDRSIGLIQDNVGVDVEHFAYPKALPGSPAAEEEVRARFATAALAGTRANVAGQTDVYRLARSPIQASDDMRWFRLKAAGGLGLEDRARVAFNRARYRSIAT